MRIYLDQKINTLPYPSKGNLNNIKLSETSNDSVSFGSKLTPFEELSRILFNKFIKYLEVSGFSLDNLASTESVSALKSIVKPIPVDTVNKTDYYHGLSINNARKVKAAGFDPYLSKSTELGATREVGIGIYLTPVKKVAQWFGIPLRTKVKLENPGTIIDMQEYKKILNEQIIPQVDNFAAEQNLKPNERGVLIETYLKELFKSLGYDGIVMESSIDRTALKMMGMDQPQLAVFDPKKITIQEKGNIENINDVLYHVFARPIKYLRGLSRLNFFDDLLFRGVDF